MAADRPILAKRLQQARIRAGLTQRELAMVKEIGCSAGMIPSYEAGKREPRLDTLIRFARYFNVTTDYLLGLCDNTTQIQEKTSEETKLSDDAIRTLDALEKRQITTLNLILSAGCADYFLDTLQNFIEAGLKAERDDPGEISENWALFCFIKQTEKIVREIRENMDIKDSGPRLGRPQKYKTQKGTKHE